MPITNACTNGDGHTPWDRIVIITIHNHYQEQPGRPEAKGGKSWRHTPHIDIAHNAITHRARRIAAAVAAVCCTLAMVAGCGAANDAADSSGSRNSIVTVNSTEPTKGLIPSNTNDMAGWRIASLIYDGLVTFSTSGELQYVEAKSIAANARRH